MMIYPELFRTLEQARWTLAGDVPWDAFEASRLDDAQAITIKMNAITEWSALPATEMFLRDNRHDSDFSAFMSVWFYEEQKHALVLMEYLRRFRPDLVPTDAELSAVRFEFDPAPALETLMLHFCGEVRLTQWYRKAAAWHTEPVIQRIYELIAADEGRHAGAYRRYMARALELSPDEARYAFAKVGVLMASGSRAGKPLHPTNLHVAKAHYPQDTVQSRLPDPGWLDRWLEEQIAFDAACEARVIERILATLSNLLGQELKDARDLSRYRRSLARGPAEEARPHAGA
jgi:Fatty acid desaturase